MIDPLQLQALVDGECSPGQRRELLEHCDSHPENWREVALAMLEEQQFSKQLHQVATPTLVATRSLVATLNPTACHPSEPASLKIVASEPLASLPIPSAQTVLHIPPVSRKQSWRPVLAAGLIGLAAFWGGRMVPHSNSHESHPKDTLATNQSTVFKPGIQPNSSGAGGLGAPNQLVSDQSNPYEGLPETDLRVQIGNQNIPIFDPNDIDPQLVLALQAYEIQKANQRLRQHGFEIDLRPEYMTGQLNDGRQVVVPIHQVGLRPYGQ